MQTLKKKLFNQPSSWNIMKEELIRKSSLFWRDMKKLNIMKEIKAYLENKERMEVFSPFKHSSKASDHQFGFVRRST